MLLKGSELRLRILILATYSGSFNDYSQPLVGWLIVYVKFRVYQLIMRQLTLTSKGYKFYLCAKLK
jgi:hypothetical protein